MRGLELPPPVTSGCPGGPWVFHGEAAGSEDGAAHPSPSRAAAGGRGSAQPAPSRAFASPAPDGTELVTNGAGPLQEAAAQGLGLACSLPKLILRTGHGSAGEETSSFERESAPLTGSGCRVRNEGGKPTAWLNKLRAGRWLPLEWRSLFGLTRQAMVGFSSPRVFREPPCLPTGRAPGLPGALPKTRVTLGLSARPPPEHSSAAAPLQTRSSSGAKPLLHEERDWPQLADKTRLFRPVPALSTRRDSVPSRRLAGSRGAALTRGTRRQWCLCASSPLPSLAHTPLSKLLTQIR